MKKSHKLLEKFALVIALSLAACAHQESFEDAGALEDLAANGEMSEMGAVSMEGESVDFLTEEGGEAGALPEDLQLGEFSDPSLGTDGLSTESPDALMGTNAMADETASLDPMAEPLDPMAEPMEEMGADPLMIGDASIPEESLEPTVEPVATQPELMSSLDLEPAAEPVTIQPELASVEEMPKPAAREYSPPKPLKRLKAPIVAEQPFSRHGDKLNRFYVLRSGDSKESVAQLLLGEQSVTTQLSDWNPAASWRTGSIVYYRSPKDPEDGSMRPFHEDRGIASKDYTVQPGETLAQIALREYGDSDSWKEIAVLNSIKYPASLDAGANLTLLPSKLSDYAFIAATPVEPQSEETEPIDTEIAQLESQISEMENEIDDIAEQKAPAIGDVAVAPEPPPITSQQEIVQGKQLASVEVNGFFRQNLALILIIAGLGTFLLFYFFVKKSKDLGDF